MRQGARILSAQMQGGILCVWAICEEEAPSVNRIFAIYGTGISEEKKGPLTSASYVSTFQMSGVDFHLFDCGEVEA
jgi:hypothetical protein